MTTYEHAELLVIYQQCTEDIERTKQWGWQVMYAPAFVSVLFSVLIAGIAGVATVYIGDADASLERSRQRLGRCRERLQEASRTLLGPMAEKHTWPLGWLVWGNAVLTIILLWAW